jgi:transposase-like protein
LTGTKSVYVALGVNFEGKKGVWIAETEGAKFWMGVLTELKNRGVRDILIACMDGLSGFPDAVRAVYPRAGVHSAHGAQFHEVRFLQGS